MSNNAIGILKYRRYEATPPGVRKGGEKKWYGKLVSDRTVEFNGLVDHMVAHHAGYSRGQLGGVLTDLLDCVKELVLDGKKVRLGDLGLFSLRMNSKPAETCEQWDVATHIDRIYLQVLNTKSWSNKELQNVARLSEWKAGSPDSPTGETPTEPGGGTTEPEPGGGGGTEL